MKKLSVCALAFVSLMASAQNKIDFAGRLAIDRVRQASEAVKGEGTVAPMSAATAIEQSYNVIVEFNGDIDYGTVAVEEVSRAGNMAIVNVTTAGMEELAALPQVKSVTLGFEKTSYMYKARPAANVEQVQAGTDGLSRAYTGKGVLTGLYDTGLDVNHINFLDADGNPRTKAVWAYASNGKETAYTTPARVKLFTTENNSESHGTHVLGIMSGGYKGPAQYAIFGGTSGRTPTLIAQSASNSAMPFYGVSTEADIAVGCGTLSDGNIGAGVQRIVDLAKSEGQACVVNLSIGSNIGPHDGTDAITKYLAQLGKDAIICIAAGNEGDTDLSISTTGSSIKTFVTPTGSSNSGNLQFWSSDNQPFTLRFIGYDKSKSKEEFSYTLDKNLEGKSVRQSEMTGFTTAFSGTITMSSNIDPNNNRYMVSVAINVTGKSTTIMPAFEIIPLSGQSVDGFANNMIFASQSVPGFTKGSPDNSISSMACGENVLVVGSFTTASSWAAIVSDKATSYSYGSGTQVGRISSFSSYGKVFGGRNLPDVCAPGEGIMSSYSQYYVDKTTVANLNGYLGGEYTAPAGRTSRNSPWGLMQGTSMACPFVAGVVGLWLEADPTLTVDDVKAVIAKTAITDTYTRLAKARFGAGKIDALAGILEVLSNTGIADVVADGNDVFVSSADNRNFDITVVGAHGINAEVYSVAGAKVAEVSAAGDNLQLSLDGVQAGVYVLRISAGKKIETIKVAVR